MEEIKFELIVSISGDWVELNTISNITHSPGKLLNDYCLRINTNVSTWSVVVNWSIHKQTKLHWGKKTVATWDAAVVGWEVGVAVGVGRLWRTSSGGGTGKTTGAALDGSLLTSKTSMGPVELLRRIWYFLCPLRDWRKHIHSLTHETQQQHRKRKYHTRNLQIRVWGPLVVCHLERGLLEVCPLWRKDRLVSEWWKLFRTADRTKRNTGVKQLPLNAPQRSSCFT